MSCPGDYTGLGHPDASGKEHFPPSRWIVRFRAWFINLTGGYIRAAFSEVFFLVGGHSPRGQHLHEEKFSTLKNADHDKPLCVVKGEFFWIFLFLCTLFNTASSGALHIPLCWRMLG
jgi:hypothetical protein